MANRKGSSYYQVGDYIHQPRTGRREKILSVEINPHALRDRWADWVDATGRVYGCRMALYDDGWYVEN